MKKNTYDYTQDQEYLDYLERERKNAHMATYDDACSYDHSEERFLVFASLLTDTPIDEIKIIDMYEDDYGILSGTIEIDGRREYIHQHSC